MKTVAYAENVIHTGELILVNETHPYQKGVSKNLYIPVHNTNNAILLERRAAIMLTELMNSIHGWSQIMAISGWRSMQEQQDIWNQSIVENGINFTKKYVAVPGHSEHQTGLAIDLGLKEANIDFIRPNFPYEGICQAFRNKAAMFGFIERYPKDKEHITGIGHEPWHFRYVGVPHAVIMTGHNLTLEEYTDFIKQFPYGVRSYEYQKNNLHIAVSFLSTSAELKSYFEINENIPYSVSGNNVDGFVITEWRGKYGCEKELRRA